MTYRELAPPADLRPFLRAFWWRAQGPGSDGDGPHRVLPDGCADLLLDCDHADGDRRVRWVGTMTRAQVVKISSDGRSGGARCIFGVRFAPGGLAAFVRAPLSAITDADERFAELGPRFALPSIEALASRGPADLARTAARVASALRTASPSSSPLLRLLASLPSLPGASVDARVDRLPLLRGLTGYSARTIERRFLDVIGVTPKQHLRYLRFAAALACLRRGQRLAELALAAGYADQAHFSREFSRFAGLSPTEYRRALST